ncbi:MAG: PEP-CTERM sorting domain-containing protein [Chthoniobacter sp.]
MIRSITPSDGFYHLRQRLLHPAWRHHGCFGHSGLTVWVSQDNVTYYQLAVPHGYGADDWLPEQGSGNPLLPVDPQFTISSFVGLNQAQALSLYNGSAGGASFSLGWAEDSGGNPVNLTSASYIEIQGTSGFGYVDAVSRVQSVPEPSGLGLLLAGIGMVGFYRRHRAISTSKNNRR